jgi:hypothetical protein
MAAVLGPGLAIALCLPAQGATPKTTRVSVSSDGTQAGAGGSHGPSISTTGRFVAFSSGATNLVADDNNLGDVFVRDRKNTKTTLVNVSSAGVQANGGSSAASISSTGRFVAFESGATNLVDDDDNDYIDIFVHDRRTKKTTRVSVSSTGIEAEGGVSQNPSISAGGRFVAFHSYADNIAGGDDDEFDVFVHDRRTKKTTRVSVRSNGGETAGGGSYAPSISASGRFVTFHSDATNLVGNDDNGVSDVFVHDRETKKTTRVSVRSNGAQAEDGGSQAPAISGSGRFVTFHSEATNLVGGPSVATALGGGGVALVDVFVHDRETKKTTRVSVRSNGDPAEGGASYAPSISASGRFVTFQSDATNLAAGDDNGLGDVFVHDRKTKKTRRVSVRSAGEEPEDGVSSNPSISGDGRFVTFDSDATNLVANDDNASLDIFVRGPLR